MQPPAADIPIILLAAGASARMRGVDKLMQQVDGQPLIRRQAELALAVTEGPVIAALPSAPHPRHAALSDTRVQRVEVAEADEGMNASLRAAIAALPPGAEAAMVLLCDLPDLREDHLHRVIEARARKPDSLVWRGATEAGHPGHPVIFSARLFECLMSLTGDTGGRDAIAAAGGRVTLVPLPANVARRDLDTPEDWAAWRAERAAKD